MNLFKDVIILNQKPWFTFSQYHGGTNFGRSAGAYMITGYYDQAPLDEYGKNCIFNKLAHTIRIFASAGFFFFF